MPEFVDLPSSREFEILQAVVSAGTVHKAADLLLVSLHTVDSTIDHLRIKSGCHTLPQITAWAIRNGWWDGGAAPPNPEI